MNARLGIAASATALAGVLGFAACLPFAGGEMGSYFFSLLIAWGFVPMACALAAEAGPEARAAAYTGTAFSAAYGLLCSVVYFTQLTSVRSGGLTVQSEELLGFQRFGLFFNLDMLGYAFMSLTTFFVGLAWRGAGKRGKWLRGLLLVHGVFFLSCTVLPMLGVFHPGMEGGRWTGVFVLEFWCLYFAPVCLLALLHFAGKRKKGVDKPGPDAYTVKKQGQM